MLTCYNPLKATSAEQTINLQPHCSVSAAELAYLFFFFFLSYTSSESLHSTDSSMNVREVWLTTKHKKVVNALCTVEFMCICTNCAVPHPNFMAGIYTFLQLLIL